MKTTFNELSRTQKRYSIILAIRRPNRVEEISSAIVRELHHELLLERESGGPKIGWPRWVFTDNKIRDGHGLVPFAPKTAIDNFLDGTDWDEDSSKTLQTPTKTVKLKLEPYLTDAQFEAEVRAAGINFGNL